MTVFKIRPAFVFQKPENLTNFKIAQIWHVAYVSRVEFDEESDSAIRNTKFVPQKKIQAFFQRCLKFNFRKSLKKKMFTTERSTVSISTRINKYAKHSLSKRAPTHNRAKERFHQFMEQEDKEFMEHERDKKKTKQTER